MVVLPIHAMQSENKSDPARAPLAPVPVLVLGGTVTALGAIRSLGPLGIPVFATCDADDVAAHSRWARVLGGGLPEFSTVETLAAFLSRVPHERMVLLPCSTPGLRPLRPCPPRPPRDFRRTFPRSP